MINIKFKGHDSGNCRVYGTHNRKLYCLMESYRSNNQLALYACSKDGEPEWISDIDYTFGGHTKQEIESLRTNSETPFLDNKVMDLLKIERRTWEN